MKFFSFSKIVVLFAAQAIPTAQVIADGEFRSHAVACTVDVCDFPTHTGEETDYKPE